LARVPGPAIEEAVDERTIVASAAIAERATGGDDYDLPARMASEELATDLDRSTSFRVKSLERLAFDCAGRL